MDFLYKNNSQEPLLLTWIHQNTSRFWHGREISAHRILWTQFFIHDFNEANDDSKGAPGYILTFCVLVGEKFKCSEMLITSNQYAPPQHSLGTATLPGNWHLQATAYLTQ